MKHLFANLQLIPDILALEYHKKLSVSFPLSDPIVFKIYLATGGQSKNLFSTNQLQNNQIVTNVWMTNFPAGLKNKEKQK